MEGSLAKIYKLLQKTCSSIWFTSWWFQPIWKTCGFTNPFENHESKRSISPGRDENKQYLKPPPSSWGLFGSPEMISEPKSNRNGFPRNHTLQRWYPQYSNNMQQANSSNVNWLLPNATKSIQEGYRFTFGPIKWSPFISLALYHRLV